MNNIDAMRVILQKIKQYDTIMLFRHKRMDGDCVGATKGLKGILQGTFPRKQVYLIDGQHSDFLAFTGADDADVEDAVYARALGIVLDTGDRARISNPKYALCRELIKIDHHIEADAYGDFRWVEPERSSACEMVAAFYATFREELTIDAAAATHLYMGMVTDSGRFRFEGVNGDTLRLAGLLLDQGVDAERLYAHLYLQDYETLKFKAYVYEHMQRTAHGVAHLYVDRAMQAQFGLSFETASSAVSYLESIRGCLCWLAFIEPPEGEAGIRVRLRSRFLATNSLAEAHHGGGHACASGATVYSAAEMQALIDEADALVAEYKATHDGWM